MQDYEALCKSLPAERANKIRKQIEAMQAVTPEIWEMLISKQRICPCDFGLPNFCVPNPLAENCKKCWDQALKFQYEAGISVSSAGYLICSKCKKHIFFDHTDYDMQNQKYHNIWICPECSKEFDLVYSAPAIISAQTRPQGWQPAAERVVETETDSNDN